LDPDLHNIMSDPGPWQRYASLQPVLPGGLIFGHKAQNRAEQNVLRPEILVAVRPSSCQNLLLFSNSDIENKLGRKVEAV